MGSECVLVITCIDLIKLRNFENVTEKRFYTSDFMFFKEYRFEPNDRNNRVRSAFAYVYLKTQICSFWLKIKLCMECIIQVR